MENYLQRVLKIAENEGITITALERNIGASNGLLSKAIKNNTDIQSKWLKIIIDNYHYISPTWLLTGDGSMFKEQYRPKYDKQVNDRVVLFCQANGIDLSYFEKETDLTMDGICYKYPNLNPVWLLEGIGEMMIHDVTKNYSITNGSGNQAINGSSIHVSDAELEHCRKRIEELERLVEQKDRMIDILTGTKR